MAEVARLGWRGPRLFAILFLALKAALLVTAQPFMDETYYFLWGQHPALSYFDHPPLVGWTAGLSAALFGWTTLGLRAAVLLTLLGDLAVLYGFARLDRGPAWREAFWPTALLFLATPIFFVLSNVALPDHLLIFFSLLAVYGYEAFRAGWEAGAPRWRFLYLAALAIGLATLSKYTGALLAAGVLVAIVASPRLRQLFRSPHLYLGMLLVAALQVPVIVWNVQHDFASFGFIVGGRAALASLASLEGVKGFLLGLVAVLSPFLLWPLGRFLLARDDGRLLPKLVFWVSTLGFLVASIFTNILIHWNVVAYVAVLPFLHPYLRSRVIAGAQVIYGGLVAALVAVNYVVLPVMALISYADQTSAWSYGWDRIAPEIARLGALEQVGFIAATDYALASPLAFALRDPGVTSLSPHREAFDDWFDTMTHRGETALVVADRWRPLSRAIRDRFDAIERIETIEIVRFGKTLDTYSIYLGHGFADATLTAAASPPGPPLGR